MEKEKLPKPEGGNTTNCPGKLRDHHHKYHGCGDGGNRHNSDRSGKLYNKHNTKQPKFEGRISGPNGHVYDCAYAIQVDQYTNMTEEIALYVATTFKNENGVRRPLKTLEFQQLSCLMTYQQMLQWQQRGGAKRK